MVVREKEAEEEERAERVPAKIFEARRGGKKARRDVEIVLCQLSSPGLVG